MAAAPSNVLKRLQKEVAMIASNMPEGCTAGPEDDNMYKWTACVLGPKSSPFAGGKFHLRLTLPKDYPFHPPAITLTTKTYHPNVNNEEGSICIGITRDEEWRPTCTMRDVVQAVYDLLVSPNPDHALDAEIADVYIKDKKKWEKTAREWTKKHANK